MKKKTFCLKTEILASEKYSQMMKEKEFASELYSALCNNFWGTKKYREKGNVVQVLYCSSMRTCAKDVADIRNEVTGGNETYLDYFCETDPKNPNGFVSDRIRQMMKEIGLKQLDL